MEIKYEKSFEKDLLKLKDKRIHEQIKHTINEIKNCTKLSEISNLKKLTGYKKIYRIRISDYRIGIELDHSKLIFTRVLHRKDICKFFP